MSGQGMRRREFITLMGSAAAACPLAARAQQGERMRRVGALMDVAADDAQTTARMAAFAQGLGELGWTIGRNLQVEYRWAAGNDERRNRYAAELVTLAPDVIWAVGGLSVRPLLYVTRTVPIVFVGVTDPVGGGLVASLARPGGNATGFLNIEFGISVKWLELLKQIAPRV